MAQMWNSAVRTKRAFSAKFTFRAFASKEEFSANQAKARSPQNSLFAHLRRTNSFPQTKHMRVSPHVQLSFSRLFYFSHLKISLDIPAKPA
jgi:hypothetical protein